MKMKFSIDVEITDESLRLFREMGGIPEGTEDEEVFVKRKTSVLVNALLNEGIQIIHEAKTGLRSGVLDPGAFVSDLFIAGTKIGQKVEKEDGQ